VCSVARTTDSRRSESSGVRTSRRRSPGRIRSEVPRDIAGRATCATLIRCASRFGGGRGTRGSPSSSHAAVPKARYAHKSTPPRPRTAGSSLTSRCHRHCHLTGLRPRGTEGAAVRGRRCRPRGGPATFPILPTSRVRTQRRRSSASFTTERARTCSLQGGPRSSNAALARPVGFPALPWWSRAVVGRTAPAA